MNKLACVNYTDELFEMIKTARFRVPKTSEGIGNCKYLYSNKYKKYLHQIVYDYYFTEEIRKKEYDLGYIIEHLDNNWFNCDIKNLYILKKLKNTYKGWGLDKEIKKDIPTIALSIYHVISNKSFQIVIAFNKSFGNDEIKKSIETIKLLYNYNYEIVLQDAEQILESIMSTGTINLKKWNELYRFENIKINYGEDIELTENEKKQGAGTIVTRNGVSYLIIGQSGNSFGFINSAPYEKDWDLKK